MQNVSGKQERNVSIKGQYQIIFIQELGLKVFLATVKMVNTSICFGYLLTSMMNKQFYFYFFSWA